MADISKRPFVNHLRSDPTSFVLQLRAGKVKRSGAGVSFWFRPSSAALAEVPLDDREQALMFQARTSDFQMVSVQATVTYRVSDPAVAATRIDFGISPRTGQWNARPLERLGGLLTELAQQPALEYIAGISLAEALSHGIGPVRQRVAEQLAADERLVERGLSVTDVRVVAIRAEADLERALQTPTREQVQQEADRATFERRAVAVENERAIAENELRNQIELARREEELVLQRGQNERKRAAEQAEADKIATTAKAERQGLIAKADADRTRELGDADATAETARFAAYAGIDQDKLVALALRELAANVPPITHLSVTPELLSPLLTRLGDRQETPDPVSE
ncbi:SPFH domain-containing protein [Aeromicrobium sp. NPDC092404]|uniref:SPFH domain-containing protein n=1 Tax=Aeromicrobium sp. NPDC092404 TaxID=3154976 RepID=UPI0034427C67